MAADIRDTYAGLGNGTSVDETGTLRAPRRATRPRPGWLKAATFSSGHPVDSYTSSASRIQRDRIRSSSAWVPPYVNASITVPSSQLRSVATLRLYGTRRGSIDITQLIPNPFAPLDGL